MKPFLTNARYGETRLEAKLDNIGRSSFSGAAVGFDDDSLQLVPPANKQHRKGESDASNMESVQLHGVSSPASKNMANDLDY